MSFSDTYCPSMPVLLAFNLMLVRYIFFLSAAAVAFNYTLRHRRDNNVALITALRPSATLTVHIVHCVRVKSSTPQNVSQLVQNCKYLPEILNSTTVTIFTGDPKAVWKYS